MKLSKETLRSVLSSPIEDGKGNFITECPYCGEREFSISISGDNHPFGCFRKKKCGEVGNIFKYLKKVGKEEILKDQETVFVNNIDFRKPLSIIGHQNKKNNELIEDQIIELPIGYKRVFNNEYLKERGFKEEDFIEYEVGITELIPSLIGFVIFPVRENNNIVAYVGRNKLSKKTIDRINSKNKSLGLKPIKRYDNSKSNFENLLYGIDEIVVGKTSTVIIVEGIFAKRHIDKKLLLRDQDDIKCLCSFGAKLSDNQLRKLELRGIKSIIVLFDGDVLKIIKSVSKEIMHSFDVKVGYLENKKPDEISDKELFKIFDNLVDPIQFDLLNLQKIEIR